jgi:ABC-type nitrate/sulfonate/bicarbonate transport system ATPase subunit
MANIEIRSVSKEFKTGKVLDRISLAAEEGEIVAIFGPSGSGKTVLLRLVAGVEQPDDGRILLGGRDVTDQAPETRGVGMAFQNFALFPHMSAFDNVASALTAHKVPREMIRAKVEKVAALLKIEHVLGHAPRELSNGQKQRTALARALVAEPKILLLDDPLRNVDAKLRYEMRLELPSLLKASGSTVLYVTQDYKEDRGAIRPGLCADRPACGDLCEARDDQCREPVRRSDDQPDPGRTAGFIRRSEDRYWRRLVVAASRLRPHGWESLRSGLAGGKYCRRRHGRARKPSG